MTWTYMEVEPIILFSSAKLSNMYNYQHSLQDAISLQFSRQLEEQPQPLSYRTGDEWELPHPSQSCRLLQIQQVGQGFLTTDPLQSYYHI